MSIWRDLHAIVRPYGVRPLAGVLALVVLQALMQTLAVFSLLPFLSAAADMARFRQSPPGRLFIEGVGGGTDQRVLILAGGLSLAILIAGNLVALWAEYVRTRYAYRIGHLLRIELLGELLDRRYEYFLGMNSSVLIKNLVDDVGRITDNLILPALDVVARGLLVALLAATVVFVEPLVVVGGGVVVALYYLAVMRPIRRRAEATSEAVKRDIRALYFEIIQILGGVKPILASARQPWFVRRAERASAAHAAEIPRIPIYSAVLRSGLEIVVFGGMTLWVLVAIVSGTDLAALVPRIGLMAVVAYRLMPSVQMLFAQVAAMTSARHALEEVTALRREQAAQAAGGGTEPAEPLAWSDAIRFDRVGFRYAGADAPTIDEASFVIGKGQRVAFVGPTGSGKSTLIDLLLGLLQPTAGAIVIDGEPLTPERMPHWRRAIGYVPQDIFLLDGTIAENVAFGAEADELDRGRVEAVTAIAQAREFIDRGPGFDARVGERGVRLSGGQRQRLGLARALYGGPTILVLDEATSALDTATERQVVAALGAAGECELTIVTVTHRLETVRDYDCIHYVEHGRIVASGDFAAVMAHHDPTRVLVV